MTGQSLQKQPFQKAWNLWKRDLRSYAFEEEKAKHMIQKVLQSANVQEFVLAEFGLLLNDRMKQNDGLSAEVAIELCYQVMYL